MPARLRVRLRRLGMCAPAPARLPLAPQASVRPTAQLRLRRPSQPSERRAFCRPTAQLRLKRPSQPSVASRGARPHAAFPSTELEHPLRGRARDRPSVCEKGGDAGVPYPQSATKVTVTPLCLSLFGYSVTCV